MTSSRYAALLLEALIMANIVTALNAQIHIAPQDGLLFTAYSDEPVNMTICVTPGWCAENRNFQNNTSYMFNDLPTGEKTWNMLLSTSDGQTLTIGPYNLTDGNKDLSEDVQVIQSPIATGETVVLFGFTANNNGTAIDNIANVEQAFYGIFNLAPLWGIVIGLGITLSILGVGYLFLFPKT